MGGLSAFLAGWWREPSGHGFRPSRRLHVRAVASPTRAPATVVERLLLDMLTTRGPLPRTALVSGAARALYRQALVDGGWLADLGLLGDRAFVPEVVRALEAGRGVLWEVESVPDEPPRASYQASA